MNQSERNIKINTELYGKIRLEGILQKYPENKPIKPGKGEKLWKSRYFVLADNLVYYDDKEQYEKKPGKPKGVICLDFAAISLHSTEPNKIALRTPGKMLILRCKDELDAQVWLNELKAAQH